MTNCERMETLISTWIDGELDPKEFLPVTDHMADCVSCLEFYRSARTLDDALLASGMVRPSEDAPEGVWRRIEVLRSDAPAVAVHTAVAVHPAVAGHPGRTAPSWLSWAAPVAAALVLAVGLWFVGRAPVPSRTAPESQAFEITLGEGRDAMSEERFIELARELLSADARYHREMLGLMYVATRAGGGSESAVEGNALLTSEATASESKILGESITSEGDSRRSADEAGDDWL